MSNVGGEGMENFGFEEPIFIEAESSESRWPKKAI